MLVRKVTVVNTLEILFDMNGKGKFFFFFLVLMLFWEYSVHNQGQRVINTSWKARTL